MSQAHILVVDDEPDIRGLVEEILEDEGYSVAVAKDAESARQARRERRPDATLLDIWMPGTDGITLLKEWAESGDITPVVMMSGHGTVETAVEATRLGAYDFLEKPLSIAKLILTLKRALETAELKRENIGLKHEASIDHELIGRSSAILTLKEQIIRIAQHETSILLTGESGSGRETVARFLHDKSARKSGPFIRVAVGGISNANSASELFGAEENETIHYGSLERANGGTLLLEDVADMDPATQARLLGALRDGSFLREGGVEAVALDARIIAATCKDLAARVNEGSFREDLYYQLNVVPLRVPPLRDHLDDLPELLSHYVDMAVSRENLPYRQFSVGAQNRLRNHAWPGNIRELRNLVQRLLILGKEETASVDEVNAALGQAVVAGNSVDNDRFDMPLKEAREYFERRYLEHQLKQVGGNISKLATVAGMERTHLYRKMRALGVDPKQVVPPAG